MLKKCFFDTTCIVISLARMNIPSYNVCYHREWVVNHITPLCLESEARCSEHVSIDTQQVIKDEQ